jgi:hypothetical protein
METQMGKPALNVCSVYFDNLWLQFNSWLSMHPPLLAKRPFESESTKINRESWGNGKANRHDLSFPIPHSFLSYLIFLFHLILFFFSFVLFTFTFALSFIVYLTFLIA